MERGRLFEEIRYLLKHELNYLALCKIICVVLLSVYFRNFVNLCFQGEPEAILGWRTTQGKDQWKIWFISLYYKCRIMQLYRLRIVPFPFICLTLKWLDWLMRMAYLISKCTLSKNKEIILTWAFQSRCFGAVCFCGHINLLECCYRAVTLLIKTRNIWRHYIYIWRCKLTIGTLYFLQYRWHCNSMTSNIELFRLY